ncbi:MAG: CHC2 zinc finger domain-containing protein [Oscillospiraceae bacterium]
MRLFDEIKSALTVEEVVTRYGYKPNRGGFIKCPFHGEKTSSLKIYPKTWHCFGCGEGGSVIDFAMLLFGCDAMGAVERLNTDFGLNLKQEHESSQERSERVRAAEAAQKELDDYRKMYEQKCYEHRRLYKAKQDGYKNSDYAEACKKLDGLQYFFEANPWR